MTDTYLSGWGNSKDKINKLVIICDTKLQARKAMAKAEQRSEMKYVNLCLNKPYYSPSKYYVTFKHIDNCSYFK